MKRYTYIFIIVNYLTKGHRFKYCNPLSKSCFYHIVYLVYTKWRNRMDLKTWTWKIPSLQIKLYGRVFLNRQPGNHIISRLLLVEKSDRFKVTVHWPSVSFFIQVSTRWLVIFSKLLLIPTYYSNIPAIFVGKFNVELIESSVNKRHKILWQSHGWLFL